MARDVMDSGKSAATPQRPRATEGGCTYAKELPYDPPKGPTEHMRQGPGLGGTNHGTKGTQGKH